MSSAREDRAGNTCPGQLAGHSCPQFSPCASANKVPLSSDPVWCIWLATLAGFAFSSSNGVWSSLDLIDKWREDSAGWCYLRHSCGPRTSLLMHSCRIAPVTELLHLGSSSSFKGRTMQAAPFPCQGTSILGLVYEKQLLSALPNPCKPHAFGGT